MTLAHSLHLNSSKDFFASIALVGFPNSGKTSLFNTLTGSTQKVGNYPGVTVEKREGKLYLNHNRQVKVTDLPGTYSLSAHTPDEALTRDYLLQNSYQSSSPELIVVVVDATNLERNLNLVLELKELGRPILVALNMIDLAQKRGLKLDYSLLAQELSLPVVPVIAPKKKGVQEFIKRISQLLPQIEMEQKSDFQAKNYVEQSPKEKLKARYHLIDQILKKVQTRPIQPDVWTTRLDKLALNPILGTFILIALLFFTFQLVFNIASYPMDWIELGQTWLQQQVKFYVSEGPLQSFLVDGLIAGVGAVIVFLPQIIILFFMLLLLEDSGYMSRAAFLMDRHMRRVGLHGRAFIPLLSSFACAIPGIMATRTIEHRRDRLITILIAPLMACSARLPVYSLLILAFIPNQGIWGPFRLQGLVMFLLYFGGILAALIVAFVLKKWAFKSTDPSLLLEMPTYKWPQPKNVFRGTWNRAKLFIKNAGTIILAASMVIWVLSYFPRPPQNLSKSESPLLYSYAGKLGKIIEPAIKPLGFDWTIGVGLVSGIAAREVIVSTLGTLYSIDENSEEGLEKSLSESLQERWSLATGLSLLVFFIFAMQCFSTLAVVRRETQSWKWPLFMFTYMSLLAYGASFITFHLTQWLLV